MRVQLINPPAAEGVDMVREGRCMQRAGAWTAVWAPISLATTAALLREHGFECRIDDCIIEGLSEQELLARAREWKPRLIILNTATPSILSDLEIARELKRELPDCFILAIGIHVTALWEQVLAECPELDGIALGEPEGTALELALLLREHKPPGAIAGLAVRDSGRPVSGPPREGLDLDSLPVPAWDLVRRELYRLPFGGPPFLLLGTSRGCPYSCRFCADPTYYGRRLRKKSPPRIAEEMIEIRDRFGIRDFLFWSESFTLDREWTKAVLLEIISRAPGMRFVVNSRADHVDPELLGLMKRAGCWMIGYGLESGSQRVLDLMNKRLSLEDNRNAVIWAKEAGLRVTAHFVLGFPGETEEETRKTIEFALSLPIDFAQFYCAVPFPGSPLYEEAREKGWLEPAGWERFEQNFSVLSTNALSSARVMELRREAYRRFYGRPSLFFQVLREDVGLRGFPAFVRMIREFRGWV